MANVNSLRDTNYCIEHGKTRHNSLKWTLLVIWESDLILNYVFRIILMTKSIKGIVYWVLL